MGLSQDICIAGLFHAVYGTTYFKHNLTISREEVRELIGDYAEHLVYTFCSMPDRTTTIINENKKGNTKMFHLACIEYANLVEQQPRFNGLQNSINTLYSIIYD